jgi:CRISPR-associated endonuclease Cas1
VADGYGVRVSVSRGRLHVADGIGKERRERTFPRVRPGISRLVIRAREGYVTLEAIRWLSELGIGYLHLDRDGTILASGEPSHGDVRVRRHQAFAVTSLTGVDVARYLLGVKVAGQAETLSLLDGSEGAREAIGYWHSRIAEAHSLGELLEAERETANLYWACWERLPVRFARADHDRVPEHWHKVGTRGSPLTGSQRLAVTPAQAVLNYLYAIGEAEARVACITVGLDPTLGIWHTDQRARDSFALDLLESIRPAIDRHAHQLISTRTFTRRDFAETSRGVVRLRAAIAEELAQTAPAWQAAIAPHAEHAAHLLANSANKPISLATPLTRQNHRDARAHVRRPRRPARAVPPMIVRRCKLCDMRLDKPDRVYCDTCLALPQERRYESTLGIAQEIDLRPSNETVSAGHETEDASLAARPAVRTSKTCKRCGEVVSHRKRVLCDACFAAFRAELAMQRRPCKACGKPVPHRKRVYCDNCLAAGTAVSQAPSPK